MIPQTFGDIRVDAVIELAHWAVDPDWLFADATAEGVAEHASWLGPRLVEQSTGKLVMSSHAFLIRTRRHTILFDTCCGNDKERGGVYPFHKLQTPFLENLAAAGVAPEQVDFVMCSHLHVDHVGWNTRLLNGEWVPTFPNARYVISRGEFDWWSDAAKSGKGSAYSRAAFADSVLPIVRHNQVMLVEDEHAVETAFPDEIRLLPLYGHTQHHCGLYLCSRGEDAILSADAVHHPIQFARPDWVQNGFDPEQARSTLRSLTERCLDSPTKLLTAHFPAPTSGRVVSRAEGVRFCFDEG